jgi:SAM-dependent methyltransferase
MKIDENLVRCRICGNGSFAENTRYSGTTERYHHRSFLYGRCQKCRSINLLETISPDYTDYFTGQTVSKLKVNRFSSLLSRLDINSQHTILDYGCGKGALVKALLKKGFQVDGYEPYDQEFSSLTAGKRYDLIFLTHVFEHIENYPSFFSDLDRFLAPGGMILTIHPSATRIPPLNDSCPYQNYQVHAPYHLIVPSDKSTISLFEKYGYSLKELIPYDVQRSGFRDNNRVSALLTKAVGGTKEKAVGIPKKSKLKAFFSSPFSFFNNMFLNTKDAYSSTFIFQKKIMKN